MHRVAEPKGVRSKLTSLPAAGRGTAHAEALDQAVARIGANLARTFQAVLDALPGAPLRPQELARSLGINKDLSSRILSIMGTRDPMEVAHIIPGPEPLRRLLRAASRRNVDADLVRRAEESVGEFERLIRTAAGDRSGLDSIISAWLPEARERVELLSKQAVFKGMSQIKGTSTDTDVLARFVHPAANGKDHDYVVLAATLGVRRLRPGARIVNEDFDMRPSNQQGPIFNLDGQAVNGHHDVILEKFCSTPCPRFEIRHEEGATRLMLAGEDVGAESAIDLVWAFAKKSAKVRGVTASITNPVKTHVCDLFLHPDVRPNADPMLEIYDTTVKGMARFRDPARALDRLQIKASIDYLGQGVSKFRCSAVPQYVEMIQYVCEKMQWNPLHFHGYRCAIDYPVYGSQICMAIDPTPDVPAVDKAG